MPFAPGTFGSLVGIAVFWLMASLAAIPYALIVSALFVVGVFICGTTAQDMGAVDPGSIVYDEIVGFLVAMFMMPLGWRWIAAGFVIYRVFDIWKPAPIHLVEQNLGLGLGIMTDDIIAGIYTLIILQAARMLIRRFA